MSDTPTSDNFVDVEPAAAGRFFGTPDTGPVVMLNLIRLRPKADYSLAPDLEPTGGIDGAGAYDLYIKGIEPLLKQTGGELLFLGSSENFLIGPQTETWDIVMLVRQTSKASFLSFASDPVAQQITAHRTAAVADSRLLPITPDPRFI